jgi:FkbM family methyltransferase
LSGRAVARPVASAGARLLVELRLPLARLLGRETRVEVEFEGERIVLEIESRREISRAASVADEAPLLRRMLEHLAPGDVVYDVGANIGMVSLFIAGHAVGRTCRVHSFEPEPRNFQRLLGNIEANGCGDRVRAHPIALGPDRGRATLFVRGGAGEGRHSLVAKKGSTRSIAIEMTTASDFARSSGEPATFVKIDVEGAEGRVLSGMETMLRETPPREIFLEIHPKGEGDRMPSGEGIDDWLRERGFERVWEERRGSGLHRHYRG